MEESCSIRTALRVYFPIARNMNTPPGRGIVLVVQMFSDSSAKNRTKTSSLSTSYL